MIKEGSMESTVQLKICQYNSSLLYHRIINDVSYEKDHETRNKASRLQMKFNRMQRTASCKTSQNTQIKFYKL